jgi:carboxyl-terminal processing protease
LAADDKTDEGGKAYFFGTHRRKEKTMKRVVLAGVSMAAVIAGAFPAAHGAPNAPAHVSYELLNEAMDRVRTQYVTPVDDTKLIYSAINGMVTSLDPHSSYMDPKEYAELQNENRGEFAGVGVELTRDGEDIKVITTLDDTPASRAGIANGDVIMAIDGTSAQGMALREAIDRMRGPAGSEVRLTLSHGNDGNSRDVKVSRAVVRVASVKFEAKGNVGYVRITSFSENTDASLRSAISNLKQQIGANLKGFVVDLRNDPGGLLDQAIAVSDDFLTGGDIVSTRGRAAEETQRYKASAGDLTDGKPIVVLINEGTASASEIVAGALQDQKRATIVGMTSFGKGSVQTIIPLGGRVGGALKLTTAKYYTPSGRSIQALGIAPDIAVSNLTEKEEHDSQKAAKRTEAALAGHFDSEANERRVAKTVVHPEDGKKYDDFQLSYALDQLNGSATYATSR